MVEPRYLVPLLPVFLCWTSQGMLEFESWVAATLSHLDIKLRRPKAMRVGLFTVMASVLTPALVAPMVKSKWEDLPLEHKEAGLWLKGRSPGSPLIMAQGPWAAYYADARHIYLPNESYATVLDYARQKRVDYLIIGARCLMHTECIEDTPIGCLLDEKRVPPDLQVVYVHAERPDYKILVYRLKQP